MSSISATNASSKLSKSSQRSNKSSTNNSYPIHKILDDIRFDIALLEKKLMSCPSDNFDQYIGEINDLELAFKRLR